MRGHSTSSLKRLRLVVLLEIVLMSISFGAGHAQEDYRTSLSVLFDFSETFYNEQTKPRISRLLDSVTSAITDFSNVSDTPLKISFLGIYELSFDKPPIATAVYQRRLFGVCKEDILCSPKALQDWLELTKTVMLSKQNVRYTDISGGIHSASLIASGQARGEKSMLILSDCKEERPPKTILPKLNLKGFNVVVVYMPLDEDAKDPNNLSVRLEHWQNTFRRAGAAKVTFLHLDGISPSQISKGLKN
jgi:hypothetical protein